MLPPRLAFLLALAFLGAGVAFVFWPASLCVVGLGLMCEARWPIQVKRDERA